MCSNPPGDPNAPHNCTAPLHASLMVAQSKDTPVIPADVLQIPADAAQRFLVMALDTEGPWLTRDLTQHAYHLVRAADDLAGLVIQSRLSRSDLERIGSLTQTILLAVMFLDLAQRRVRADFDAAQRS